MKVDESDNESVESGSCTCSDYNSDCSWFYDSRNLETSYMRFCIVNNKCRTPNLIRSTKQLNSDYMNPVLQGKEKLVKSNSTKKDNKINDDKLNMNNNNVNEDLKKNNFPPENAKESENNDNAHVEKIDFTDKDMKINNSPRNYYKRRWRFLKNMNENKTEQKESNKNLNNQKESNSPKKNLFNSNFDVNMNNTKKNEVNTTHKNLQTRGRTIKEKVVKEIKNITLQPGQAVKPKTIPNRKLKPNTSIITNDDGTQNIITENTTLTTIIVNELIDSSKLYDDQYPLDVQLVKQYITKIYKIETENNPYKPKSEF